MIAKGYKGKESRECNQLRRPERKSWRVEGRRRKSWLGLLLKAVRYDFSGMKRW